jgi:WD40 repeat protein
MEARFPTSAEGIALERQNALPVVWTQRVYDYATALTASNDGSLVAVGTGSGEVQVFDCHTGRLHFKTSAHAGGVLGASFSPRAQVLATVGQDGYARLHDAAGQVLAEIFGGAPWVEQLAWAPDGRHFATSSGRTARVWTKDGAPICETEAAESTITGIGWNRKSSQLATACYGGVRIADARAGKTLRHFAWQSSLISLAWSPNDTVIACGTQECSVHFWRVASGKDSEMSGYASKPRALAWDADAAMLATGGDAAVSVWSFRGKGPEGKPPTMLVGHEALCTVLAFHPKVPLLASGGDDTRVLLWNPRSPERQLVGCGLLAETVTGLTWTQGGKLLVATDAEGTLRAWAAPRPHL